MALKKSIEISNSGAKAEYWRIAHVENINFLNQDSTAIVRVVGYLNKAARKGGKKPLSGAWYEIELASSIASDVLNASTTNPISGTELYKIVKDYDFENDRGKIFKDAINN